MKFDFPMRKGWEIQIFGVKPQHFKLSNLTEAIVKVKQCQTVHIALEVLCGSTVLKIK